MRRHPPVALHQGANASTQGGRLQRNGAEMAQTWTPKKSGTERLIITPAMAEKMLERNECNRRVSVARVKRIATKMAEGRWVETHQGMAFDDNGNVLDGQHRLLSIIESKTKQPFLVSYGYDQSTFAHIDVGGSSRDSADLLSIIRRDAKNVKSICGVASYMMQGLHTKKTYDTETVAEAADWYYDTMLNEMVSVGKRHPLASSSAVLGAFAACARPTGDGFPGPTGNRDLDDVMVPLMRFCEGEWTGKDDPMRRLFEKLLHAKTNPRSNVTRWEKYAYAVSALRLELKGKSCGRLQVTTVDWGDPGDSGKRKRSKSKSK